ncbi:hypothetical protein [Nitrosotalea sinensis]|uniref:hypothetical protein n=1 Tax=Nitrosotalea sinensis TaxID=1499975 RepID=UPI0013FDC205|nr:hypothetical protein [Candidatus Nitrosotalea sinensis]
MYNIIIPPDILTVNKQNKTVISNYQAGIDKTAHYPCWIIGLSVLDYWIIRAGLLDYPCWIIGLSVLDYWIIRAGLLDVSIYPKIFMHDLQDKLEWIHYWCQDLELQST